MRILVIADRLNLRSDEGATKATIEFIRSLEGDKTLISIFEGNFEPDGTRVIRLPIIKIRIIEDFIYALVTIYHTAKIKADNSTKIPR